ncbi:DNA-directed RNA polymerase III subunit [Tasmannia lanceolata]|uniref:DNA-directed RNA polymerase III subunit n=1 Tax=Tasmannia lanceolata TaxID=3420 RepID=UPI0040644D7C
MSYRGRGRGRGGGFGRGGGYTAPVKEVPFVPFPEDVKLPEIPTELEFQAWEKTLCQQKVALQKFLKYSPYHLDVDPKSNSRAVDIERYSDVNKPETKAKRDSLSHFLKLTPANFPLELLQGLKRVKHDQKNLRWDPESGLSKMDMFEKLEQKYKGQDGKGEKVKKEGESEDDEGKIEEEEEEDSDDGDYNQNIDFDDDEDDLNMDDGDDEPCYDD